MHCNDQEGETDKQFSPISTCVCVCGGGCQKDWKWCQVTKPYMCAYFDSWYTSLSASLVYGVLLLGHL